MNCTNDTYEIQKDETYYIKWQLWNTTKKHFVCRFKRKKEALLVKKIFEGDLSVAARWYRLCLSYAIKDFRDRKQALRFVVLSANQYGLTAEDVLANPITGEPITHLGDHTKTVTCGGQ